ncbi:hypothetical protein [Peribacillus sp. SCS-155]|uniref:hypothetical protein n=1 Tax=Peribacillus sedimenti TaxID=3115297 RepID=UPI0039069F27
MAARKTSTRLPRDYLGLLDTPVLHLRNPYLIAWWSVAFPGFGHLLLGKYFRGLVLVMWEFFINQYSKVNAGMVYSFMGDIETAKEVIDVKLLLLYMPVYFFGIWDSYRTAVDLNDEFKLSERENSPIRKYTIESIGINYLDKRSPVIAILWSLGVPSLGQIYQHRLLQGFFTLIWTIIVVYYSHFMEALVYLIQGDIERSTNVLDMQWLLFLPSFYFYTVYDAYINTVEINKLFDKEQSTFLTKNFQDLDFKILKGKVVE